MSLFKKKIENQVTENTFRGHLEAMRANYKANVITSKTLPKPLWLRLHKNDELHVIYRDKDTVFQQGQVYYAYLVQANEMLFDKSSKTDLPANVLYSTHPVTEKYPELLMSIGSEIFSYKGKPESEVPEELREMVRIITAETDRSNVDFSISFPDPDDPEKMIENVDVHFCSVIVFRKDIPNHVLTGEFYPVLAAPHLTPAVIILPKEYWTAASFSVE